MSETRLLSRGEALKAASDALSALTCPYYVSEDTCESGCHQEPRCITDTPTEGWERSLSAACSQPPRGCATSMRSKLAAALVAVAVFKAPHVHASCSSTCKERVARKQCSQTRVHPCVTRAVLTYRLNGWKAAWMHRIPGCESGWNPYAFNPSGATGLFQILYPSTWATTPYSRHSPYSAKWNALAAAVMVRAGRTSEWVCSA